MPEGHTIHRFGSRITSVGLLVSRLLRSLLKGVSRANRARYPGVSYARVTAHGKHLFYHFTTQTLVHVHLGLYGKFRVHKNPAGEPRGAVRWRMMGDERTFDLNGPNCCELINGQGYQALIKPTGRRSTPIQCRPGSRLATVAA